MEKLIIWNELTEESGSDDDDEANMETIYVLLLRRWHIPSLKCKILL